MYGIIICDMSVTAAQSLTRAQLLDLLDRQIDTAGAGHNLALLLFDLRDFRRINAGYGQRVGDAVLAAAAERIRQVLRPGDPLFYLGHDEFAVLLLALKTPQVAELAMQKIHAAISGRHTAGGLELAVAVRCGGAVYPLHASNGQALLQAADMALYQAKMQQQERMLYEKCQGWGGHQQLELQLELAQALNDNRLKLYYQPQFDLQRGRVHGFETLLRWYHAEHGWISPEVFIAVAERSELIDQLSTWTFNTAMREQRRLHDILPRTALAINLSPCLLNDREIVTLVHGIMNIWGTPPETLVLEITENAMMTDPARALCILEALHDLGIRLSIDDFGTGYSSLAYLQRLPVDELKIDKTFVLDMVHNQHNRQIVQSVIDLAHNLGMHVVAEGIEDAQTRNMLVAMGCDYGQGYHFARPLPLTELCERLPALADSDKGVADSQSDCQDRA